MLATARSVPAPAPAGLYADQVALLGTENSDPQGILALRETIARDVGERRGLRITADRVVVFPGARPPIGFCHQACCDPGDEVVYPSPGFPIHEFWRYP